MHEWWPPSASRTQQSLARHGGLAAERGPESAGFVSAHWLEPIDGVGMSIIVVESKEHADKAAVYRSRYCRASRR